MRNQTAPILTDKNADSARLAWIDVLKGIGIILVVTGHVYSNQIIYRWIYSFHMPLFFLAAGWTYREKSFLMDIKRRVQSIVIPYISFGLLILVYWQLIERNFRESTEMNFVSALRGLLSGEYRYLDFNVHLWFLPCFFVTVVSFNIFVNIGVKLGIDKILAYCFSIMACIVYTFFSLPDLPWGFDKLFAYIGFYAVGCILHGFKADAVLRKTPLILQIVFAGFLLAVNFGLSYAGLTTGVMWFITAFIGITAVGTISIVINHSNILQYLGRISLVVLCVHGPIYRVIIKLVSIPLGMDTDTVRENFMLSMLVVGLTMAICSFVYEVVSRIAPWMIRKRSASAC